MRIKIKTHKKPAAYRWAAVGTLVAYSALGTRTTARAQDRPSVTRPAAGTTGAQPVRRFDIPAASLGAVAGDFERVTGIRVSIVKAGIRSIASPGVSGAFTADQALQRLLNGTGVVYRYAAPDTIALDLADISTSVEVTADVEALPSSPKYSAPLLDTPQTITAIPQQILDQQNVTTLRDTLRNVAGISLAAGEGGAQGDNLTIRGFSARNDLYIDGMRDFGSYYRDPFDLEEVEVLQGPSSVTFGRGSTGGVVNQATKTPMLARSVSGDLDLGTDATRRLTADLNEPLGVFGPHAAFRLNVMGDMNGVAGRDVAENRRFGVAPSLAFGLGTSTRWTLSYLHEGADDIPDYGIPWLFNGPAPVDRHNYYGFKNANYLRTYDDIGTVKVEHDFSHAITLRNQVRYANYARYAQITEPKVVVAGTLGTPTLTTPAANLVVNPNEITVNSVEAMLDEQLDLTAKFETGSLRHSFVAGFEASKEISDPTRPKWTNVPLLSLADPNPDTPFSGTETISSIVHTTAVSEAAYALDTVSLGRRWDLSGGVRYDHFNAAYTQQVATASAFNRIDNLASWRAALVYKPAQNGSIYFDAGTSFNPSAESLSLSASTANLPPEENLTYELGSKWELGQHHLTLRGALFRTDKTNAREPDPNNPLLNVLAGQQRVNGAELQVQGHITSRWELLSSFAYLDSQVVSSKYYPVSVGLPLANVPRYTYNFWSSYRLPHHWHVGAGANFVASRTASSTAPFDPVTGMIKQVPAYWVFNAMVERPLTEHVDVQANVNNLANRYYYDELHPGHIVLGAGRSALIGLKFKF